MKFKLKIKIDYPFCAKLVANDERLIITLRSPKSMERLAKVVPEFTEWAAMQNAGIKHPNLNASSTLTYEEVIHLSEQIDNNLLIEGMIQWFGFRHSDFALTSLDEMVEVGCITDGTDTYPACVHPTGWIGIGPEVVFGDMSGDMNGTRVDGYRKLYAPSVNNPTNYFNHLVSSGSLVFYGVQNDRT